MISLKFRKLCGSLALLSSKWIPFCEPGLPSCRLVKLCWTSCTKDHYLRMAADHVNSVATWTFYIYKIRIWTLNKSFLFILFPFFSKDECSNSLAKGMLILSQPRLPISHVYILNTCFMSRWEKDEREGDKEIFFWFMSYLAENWCCWKMKFYRSDFS